MATYSTEQKTPEIQSNAARVRAILLRQVAELESRGQQRSTDIARIREAISKIDEAWQPTAPV